MCFQYICVIVQSAVSNSISVFQKSKGVKPAGKVVGILSRNWRQYCGSLQETNQKEGSVLFVAVDQKVPKIRIQSRQVEQLLDKRIVVAIDSWPVNSKFPLGHYVKTLGVIGERDCETQVLMMEHEVTDPNWSDAIIKSLPPPDYSIPQAEIDKRLDLRSTCIFSIDPPGCKDIDDALHLVELPNGPYFPC
jgi:exosome complex exonuclease DIS3/RRP44